MDAEAAARREINCLIVMKHVCKLCRKRFPCGRSLGGHMRSHLITIPTDHRITHKEKVNRTMEKKKNKNQLIQPPPTTSIANNSSGEAVEAGYELRENQKKTWRAAKDSSDEDPNLLPSPVSSNHQSKSCKQCGKAFHSSKALSGHMKSHAVERQRERQREKVKENISLDDHDSCATAKQQVMDSQSDTEIAAPASTHRPRRSSRRSRYMEATSNSSSSPSLADNNNNGVSSSVSEIDQQEQEEVALSLIMLSRDVGSWVGISGSSTGELSDNNSSFLEAPQPKRRLQAIEEGGEDKGLNLLKSSCVKNVKISEGSLDFVNRIELCGAELGRNLSSKSVLIQADITDPANSDPGTSKRKMETDVLESGKRSKFECTTCNKTFHSYQALGGHKASHKKSKGCSPSKMEDRKENAEISGSVSHHNQIKDMSDERSKKGFQMIRQHECPICFKVFPSGQALGGHKSSHLIAMQSLKESKITSVEKSNATTFTTTTSSPECRDFLDLNLPAPLEEEASNGYHNHQLDLVGFNPWWVERTQKHEQLVALISN